MEEVHSKPAASAGALPVDSGGLVEPPVIIHNSLFHEELLTTAVGGHRFAENRHLARMLPRRRSYIEAGAL